MMYITFVGKHWLNKAHQMFLIHIFAFFSSGSVAVLGDQVTYFSLYCQFYHSLFNANLLLCFKYLPFI